MTPAAGRQVVVQRQTTEQERGLGRQGGAPEPRFLVVGKIVGAHGIRGELKVEVMTQDPHRFQWLDRVYLGLEDEEPVPWALEGYRLHKGRALLQLNDCRDRTTAETLQGLFVQVPLEEAISLQDGEYFEYQIIGLEAWAVTGERMGKVVEIIFTGANDVYVVHGPAPDRREILIPVIEGVVLEIDLDEGQVTVELPEGLI